jgi:leukotriene-A4 hydrolase
LRVVEEAVGRDRFTRYLRSWFDRHAFASVTTAEFVADLREHLFGGDVELERSVGVSQWIHEPGIPGNVVRPTSSRLARVDEQVRAFVAGEAAATLDVQGWSAQEWRHFLNALPRQATAARLADLDGAFRLSAATNSEILFAWLRLAAFNAYRPAAHALEGFLLSQGRGKFVKPLYAALGATEWGQREGRRIYRRARPQYHAAVTAALDPLVG